MLSFWDLDCDENGVADTCDVGCAGFGGRCGAIAACDLNPALACLGGTAEVPTMSQWGLLLLGLALAMAGLVKLRS